METKASRCFCIQLAIRSESRPLLFRGHTICEPQVKRLCGYRRDLEAGGDSPVTPVRYYWTRPPRRNICVERS